MLHRSALVRPQASPQAQPNPGASGVAVAPSSSAVAEALVAGAPPIPAGQSDNYPDNAKYEPTIARDPVTGRFVASALDGVVVAHFYNAGASAVYTSADGAHWSHPSFAAGSSRDCRWSSDVLPGYCDLGYYSSGDVTAVFGPKPDSAGHFSYANGARAYISNDLRSVFQPFGPGIAVSRSDDDGFSWATPTLLATPNATFDSDKSVIWADGDPHSRCFGTVYDAWTQFLNPNTPQEHGPVLLARSIDGGTSFSPPLTITAPGSTDDTAVGAIQSLRDGTVVVAWGSYGSQATASGTGPTSVEVALSHDCGRSFAAPVTVAQLSQGHGVSNFYRVPGTYFRVSSIPSMATHGEHVSIAWSETDPTTGGLVVRAARSSEDGNHWTVLELVSDPQAGNAFMPAIGATGDRVIIAYANVTASSSAPGLGVASIGMVYAIAGPSDHVFVRRPLTSHNGDPDGTDGFVGDYTSIITAGRGDQARAYPIWTDDRDAVPCAQWDAYQAALAAGQNPPYPDVNHVCPGGWGTSEIWSATISLGDGQDGTTVHAVGGNTRN